MSEPWIEKLKADSAARHGVIRPEFTMHEALAVAAAITFALDTVGEASPSDSMLKRALDKLMKADGGPHHTRVPHGVCRACREDLLKTHGKETANELKGCRRRPQ